MSLATLLAKRIRKCGPISVADYMEAALSHPEFGYYMRKDPFGVHGDFITAPEISQIFGELIGAWLAAHWLAIGKPEAALVEIGPGRGTLMCDILRATKTIPGFHAAISIHLVESSPALQQKQWKALAGKHEHIYWHSSVAELPEKPLLLVANEFFDALPIRQFIHTQGAWKERAVGLCEGVLEFTTLPLDTFPLPEPSAKDGAIFEVSEATEQIARTISQHIARHGGTALIIDYGHEGGFGDTLQAVKAHTFYDALRDPGEADITAHVDFGAIKNIAQAAGLRAYGPRPQGAFLGSLGAIQRALHLCEGIAPEQQTVVMAGLSRLLAPDQMGELFKVMCLVPAEGPTPEGFA